MRQCPVRSFCCKLTRPFLVLGLVLLASGFVFCDSCHKPTSAVSHAEEISAPVYVPQKPEHQINVQQGEIKRRLKRIERRIERLKQKRNRLKNVEQ